MTNGTKRSERVMRNSSRRRSIPSTRRAEKRRRPWRHRMMSPWPAVGLKLKHRRASALDQHVVAGRGVEDVLPRPADQHVVAGATDERVVAGRADQDVVPVAAVGDQADRARGKAGGFD